MRESSVPLTVGILLCIALPAAAGDPPAKLVGRWTPVVTAPAPTPTTAPAASPDGTVTKSTAKKSKSAPKKAGSSSKSTTKAAVPPKAILEFTKDGKIRLDGDVASLGDLKFLKPLRLMSDYQMKVAP